MRYVLCCAVGWTLQFSGAGNLDRRRDNLEKGESCGFLWCHVIEWDALLCAWRTGGNWLSLSYCDVGI